jgi:hypothetical protein
MCERRLAMRMEITVQNSKYNEPDPTCTAAFESPRVTDVGVVQSNTM